MVGGAHHTHNGDLLPPGEHGQFDCVADDKDGLYIKANGGVLKILEIQGENAKRMPTADFLRGNHLIAGMIFSKEI